VDRALCVAAPAQVALGRCASLRGKTVIVHPGRHLAAYRPQPRDRTARAV